MNAPEPESKGIENLKPYCPRQFVPEKADLTDRQQVQSLMESLLNRPIESRDDLRQWVLDRSETSSAIGQARAVLYVRMTCQTDDAQRSETYKKFVENVDPILRTFGDKLDRKLLEAEETHGLDRDAFGIYLRDTRLDVELFREENVPLSTKESLLSQEYQSVTGSMMVEFRGEQRTMQQMAKFLFEPERSTRQEAWEAAAARRLDESGKLEDLFDRMLEVRTQIAANAGYDDFCDYQFRAYHRFDYTPADCRDYHKTVQETVVGVYREILQARKKRMQLETLRPWDTAVDPDNRPPLEPFETTEQLVEGCLEIFSRMDRQLSDQLKMMHRTGLLDLESRKGKAPGGYQCTLSEARVPFIFANAVGLDDDVRTLLHEAGHAFHSLACADQPIRAYRHAPMEFSEVASMSMELLAGEHLDVFYDRREDFVRSRREHLESVVYILAWVATIDAFQQWIYAHPDCSGDDRAEAWVEISSRFSGAVVDYSGYDEARKRRWHRQLHIFEVPFYYIEYGIAQLGALQLWAKSKEDPQRALADYKSALALGGSRPLPELFQAAGIRFDFSAETIGPLLEMVQAELGKLSD